MNEKARRSTAARKPSLEQIRAFKALARRVDAEEGEAIKARARAVLQRHTGGRQRLFTKRGLVKARMVPADYFDERKQAEVLSNMARIRDRLAKKGKTFTREEIRAALESGRR